MKEFKLLICDDSKLIRLKLKKFLSDRIVGTHKIKVEEAANGEEGVQKYKKLNPDLMFIDLIMPKKDGLTAISEIRAYDKSAMLIVISSVGTKENLRQALKNGAYDFIQKPLDEEKVLTVLNKLIK